MKPEDVQKLLGGYATGTLTPEEQQALFEAALHDQQLFDALAKEQALRDLLRDPAARAHVLASMDDRPLPWWRRGGRWAVAGATLAACIMALAGIYLTRGKPEARPVLVAESKAEPQPFSQAAPPAVLPPVRKLPVPAIRPPAEPVRRTPRVIAPFRPVAPSTAPPPPAAAAPPPAPVSIPTVEAMAQAQNVMQPATSGSLQPQNARALFYGGSQFLPSSAQTAVIARTAPSNLGVKWTALRKDSEGLFVEVDPAQIQAGDTIKLRLVPNDNGYLSVMEGSQSLLPERGVLGLQPVETPEVTSAAGKKELVVVLSRRPESQPVAKASAPLFRSADQSEHSVYEVAASGNLFQPVKVKITLNFQ